MSQNERVRRPRSPRPRWGRSSVNGVPSPPADTGAPPEPAGYAPQEARVPPPGPYAPRRRYPWHDDPHYDPASYRRAPAPSWPPPSPRPTAHPGAPGHADDPTAHLRPGRVGPVAGNPGPPTAPLGPPNRADAGPAQPAEGTTRKLPPESDQRTSAAGQAAPPGAKLPRKITVTRVAAMRSRQFAEGTVRAFHRAATADGADRSGLTALTYATMMTYAVDAAVAVALANTLFFAAAKAESVTNVALYLAITAAPFAVVAPVIGPLLDRVQRGRRAALALTFALRAVLAVVMAFQYHTWLLYPAALGTLVLSKSFVVLKAAVTPRVLPSAITLVTTNSRLTTFGLAAGGVSGGVAAGVAWLWGSEGALVFTALLAVVGTVLCLRIPKWVESTAGEVPAALLRHNGAGEPRWAEASRSRSGATARSACSRDSSRCSSRSSSNRPTPSPPSSSCSSGSSASRPGSAPSRATRRVRGRGRSPVLSCCGAWVRRWWWRPGRGVARHRHGGRGRARGGGRERARQGQPGCGDPTRFAGGVARVGVRPVGDGAPAGVGDGRSPRRAAVLWNLCPELPVRRAWTPCRQWVRFADIKRYWSRQRPCREFYTADDRRWNRDTGACSCHRRWRCWASGNRYRASFGSSRVRLPTCVPRLKSRYRVWVHALSSFRRGAGCARCSRLRASAGRVIL